MSKTTRGKRTLNLDYLAGFFDGEGSIFITKINNKRSGNTWYRLSCSCANSDKQPINMLRKFNPTLKLFSYIPGRKCTYKPIYQWLVTGNTALNFLSVIEKHLIVKKGQAKIAIEFQEWRNKYGNSGKKRPQSYLNKCEEYRQKLKKLNLSTCSRND